MTPLYCCFFCLFFSFGYHKKTTTHCKFHLRFGVLYYAAHVIYPMILERQLLKTIFEVDVYGVNKTPTIKWPMVMLLSTILQTYYLTAVKKKHKKYFDILEIVKFVMTIKCS